MPFERKWEIFDKINSIVLKTAMNEIRGRHPNRDKLSQAMKLHEPSAAELKFRDNLFNKLLKTELNGI